VCWSGHAGQVVCRARGVGVARCLNALQCCMQERSPSKIPGRSVLGHKWSDNNCLRVAEYDTQ
jgi:hypothetical protein